MSTLTSFSHSKYVMPMIVERAGFVINLSSDSLVDQGDDEWLENHSMYCAWWSIMEDTNHLNILCISTKIKLSIPVEFIFICCKKTKTHQHTHEYWPQCQPTKQWTNKPGSTVNRLPYPDAPSLLLRVTLTDLESCPGFLVLVWALVCPVFLRTTSKAAISLFVFLLTLLNGRRWQLHSNR